MAEWYVCFDGICDGETTPSLEAVSRDSKLDLAQFSDEGTTKDLMQYPWIPAAHCKWDNDMDFQLIISNA